MKNLFFVMAFAILVGIFSSVAQTHDGNNFNSYYTDPFANIIPPTPNAANFIQYGNLPVNASTGLPNISIPIYTIEVDGVQVPISLNYDASGIKVDDISSTVGLKWSLSAGGMVSRTINDIDDLITNGWTLAGTSSYFDQWQTSNPNYDYSDKMKRDALRGFIEDHDNFPDNFSYSFLNYSGSFIFRPNGDVLQSDYSDNLIASITGRDGFQWEDLYGNDFNFGTYFETNEIVTTSYTEGYDTYNNSSLIHRTGWMLSNIETKNGKNIFFDYKPYNYNYGDNVDVSQRIVSSLGQECSTGGFPLGSERDGAKWLYNHDIKGTRISNNTTNQLIRHINTENVEIEFVYTNGPANGKSVSGWDERIDRIIIRDKLQDKEKEFKFSYDVFDGDSRLKLTQVQEKGFENTLKPAYTFTYDPSNYFGLPSPNTFGKDYKGFYNGQDSNTSLLPKTVFSLNRKVENNFGGTVIYHYPKYERLSDRYFYEDFLKIGSLKKIDYPTGGSTEFIYEANAFGTNEREPVVETRGFLMTNLLNEETNIPDYMDQYSYIYSQLAEMDHVEGPILLSLLPNSVCPDCYCSSCLETPALVIYEYDGDVDDPIDYSNVGNEVLRASIWPTNSPTANYVSFNPSASTDTYIIMMKLGGTASGYNGPDDYPMFLHLDWNKKAVDASGDVIFQKNYLGGLRIKEIKDVDSDGTTYNHTKYNYLNAAIADEFDSSMNIARVSGQSGLGGQLVFTADMQWEHGTQPSSGYCYTEVEIEKMGNGSYGKTIEYYYPKNNFYRVSGGNLKEKIIKNTDGNLLFHEKTTFKEQGYQDLKMQFAIPSLQHHSYSRWSSCIKIPPDHSIPVDKPIADYSAETANQKYYGRWRVPDSTMTTQFLLTSNGLKPVTTVKKYDYSTDPFLVAKETVDTRYTATLDVNGDNITGYDIGDSQGEVIETEYKYTKEFKPATIPWTVPDGLPVSKEVLDLNDPNIGSDDLKILGQYFEYDNVGNIKNTYRYNKGDGTNNGPLYVPPGAELYVSYLTEQGRPTQVRGQDGVITSYIWGYNDQYPVAKIVGLSYALIPGATITNIKELSIEDPHDEEELIAALNGLRTSYPNAQITTYTYVPMVGISTITDPKGIRVDYLYDDFGRLEYVRDQDNNILGKNEYHYKN